jgi:hypothetical protein|tara:strand:+ start:194 stop:454 length:261 start_codon:yes stop_codon:yes gene_type:complete
MQYRVYIIHTSLPANKKQLPKTEYYPRVNKEAVNKKIDLLCELTSPITDEHNCLRWDLENKQIEMTVIDNETNETVETANTSFLSL